MVFACLLTCSGEFDIRELIDFDRHSYSGIPMDTILILYSKREDYLKAGFFANFSNFFSASSFFAPSPMKNHSFSR